MGSRIHIRQQHMIKLHEHVRDKIDAITDMDQQLGSKFH